MIWGGADLWLNNTAKPPQIRISLKRDMKHFDNPTSFTKVVGDVRNVVDILSSDDKSFSGVQRVELDAAVQVTFDL